MNEDIVLSVCVVSYNHRKYIEQAIDSILNQKTDFKVEVIVADDASPDKTADFVQEHYGDKVRLIKRTKNVGLSRNLYECMSAAKGKYIYTHAGDDWLYDNDMFQKHVDFLEEHQEYASISHWTDIIDEKGKKIGVVQNTSTEYTLTDFLMGKHVNCQDSMMRNYWKDEKDTNHFLYECGRNNEENALNIYIMEKGPKYIVQESLACYRYISNNNSDNYNSTHNLIDVFQDNYESLQYLETIRGIKYDFKFMKIRLIYEFLGGAVKRDKSIGEMLRILNELSSKDKKMLFKNLPSIIRYKGWFPVEYVKNRVYKTEG